jgi:hypothetical protein
MKATQKPVTVEAVLYDGALVGEPDATGKAVIPGTCPTWWPSGREARDPVSCKPRKVIYRGETLCIGTLEGYHNVKPGDWIIKGVKGEIYPCKPDIFELTYGPAE